MFEGGEDNLTGPCEEFDARRILFATGELEPEEMAEVNEHLRTCNACSAAIATDGDVLRWMNEQREEPDAALLASCRAQLVDALDQQEEGGWLRRTLGAFVPASLLAPRPAFSAALLVVLGFSVGLFGPKLLNRPAAAHKAVAVQTPSLSSGADTAAVTAESSAAASEGSTEDLTPLHVDLRRAEVAGINVFPAGPSEPPQVQVQLRAEQPVVIRGSVNDSDVKHALINILRNNQRFDPDMRLDAVDLLSVRSDDPEVRSALCQAVHTDQNVSVRLKALSALTGSAGGQDQVRQALIDALMNDQNPGVRVEAMNTLRDMAESGRIESDRKLVETLRDRMQKDPNNYIRLQSAATLRDLAPSSKF
jgi:hypothetical protein